MDSPGSLYYPASPYKRNHDTMNPESLNDDEIETISSSAANNVSGSDADAADSDADAADSDADAADSDADAADT